MRYEWGHHSSEIECPHIALVTDEGRDEIFDVRIPFTGEVGDETDPAFIEGKAAMELLIARANAAIRIHAMLTGTEWHAGTIEEVANIITSTGFTIDPPNEHDQYALPDGERCDCRDRGWFMIASDGDDSRDWIERCDDCRKFDTDDDAAEAAGEATGRTVAHAPLHEGTEDQSLSPRPYLV